MQLALQDDPLQGLGAHRLVVDLVAVAPLLLGLVHGAVGVSDQVGGRAGVEGVEADADAGGEEHLLPLQGIGERDRLQDAPGHLGHVLEMLDIGEHDGELVPPQARHQRGGAVLLGARQAVALPDAAQQAVRHVLQQAVPDSVPQGVVHQLEAVQVEEEHREHPIVAVGEHQRLLQLLQEEAAVGEPGQGVVVGEQPDLLLGVLSFRDVLDGSGQADRGPPLVQHRHQLRVQGALHRVLQEDPVVEAQGGAPGDRVVQGVLHEGAVQLVHRVEDRVAPLAPVGAADVVDLLGAADLAGGEIPLPGADVGEALGVRQPFPAFPQLLHGAGGAQHVAHPVAQDVPVDRLGDEVRGARLVGAVDGLQVVQAGHHEHRGVLSRGGAADRGADRKAVQPRHHDVQ